MNSLAKGKRIEAAFVKRLESFGHQTYRAVYIKWMPKDIFGVWDIVSKDPKNPDFTYYWQISTQWKGKEWFRKLEPVPQGRFDLFFLVKYVRGKFILREIHKNGNCRCTEKTDMAGSGHSNTRSESNG